jgi:hypothetical protein
MKVLINLSGEKSGKWLRHSRMLGITIKPYLEANVLVNQLYLRTHHVPPLYRSGIRYMEEPPSGAMVGPNGPMLRIEDFALIPVIIERGWGDCDDLSPWRIAELREAGERAKVRIQWKKHPETGQKLFHVVVRREDGSIEDPSLKLGMRT